MVRLMEVKIYKNTSSEGIRNALSGFGRFSSVEIDEEKNPTNKESVLIFREVGFFKGLHRLIFKSKEELERSRNNSQRFLIEFSQNSPYIEKLLGSFILEKKSWKVGELREKLKLKTDLITRKKNTDLLEISTPLNSKVGVIDAKSSNIKADYVVEWKIGPTKLHVGLPTVEGPSESTFDIDNRTFGTVVNGSRKTISFIHADCPDDVELREAYKAALKGASGHVVIEPIYDIPVSEIKERQSEYEKENLYKICSDQSIRILLEEVDKALLENANIKNVTITRCGVPDGRFLSRVYGQRFLQQEENRTASKASDDDLTPMPKILKIINDEQKNSLMLVKVTEIESELSESKIPGVFISDKQTPWLLRANKAFLSFDAIENCASNLASSGMGQLQRVLNISRDEVNEIKKKTNDQWGIKTFELPACELPADQVFAIQDGTGEKASLENAKAFFIRHLENFTGRVVIEVRGKSIMRAGMLSALKELSQRPDGLGFECVLSATSRDIADGLFDLVESSE